MYGFVMVVSLMYLILAVVSPPGIGQQAVDPPTEPDPDPGPRESSGTTASTTSTSSSMAMVQLVAEEEEKDTVYVALGKEVKENEATLLWTLHNFRAKSICIIHIHKPAKTTPAVLGANFSLSSLDEDEVEAYLKIQKQDMEEALSKYLAICQAMEVQAEGRYIIRDDVEEGIVELISRLGIRQLVMGAAGEKHKYKKLVDLKSRKAIYVQIHAPASCQIWFVYKGDLIQTREGSLDLREVASSSQASPRTDIESSESLQSPKAKAVRKKMKKENSKRAKVPIGKSIRSFSHRIFQSLFDASSDFLTSVAQDEHIDGCNGQENDSKVFKMTLTEPASVLANSPSNGKDVEPEEIGDDDDTLDEESIMSNVESVISRSRGAATASSRFSDVSDSIEFDFAQAKATLEEFLHQDLKTATEAQNKKEIVSSALLLSRLPALPSGRRRFLLEFEDKLEQITSSFASAFEQFSRVGEKLKARQEAVDHIMATQEASEAAKTRISEVSNESANLSNEIRLVEEKIVALREEQEAKTNEITQLQKERKQLLHELGKQSTELMATKEAANEWKLAEESTSLRMASLYQDWEEFKALLW